MPEAVISGLNPEIAYEKPQGVQDERERRIGDPEPGEGLLLTEPDETKVARHALKLWKAQDKIMQRRKVQWRANALARMGIANVMVTKDQDTSRWRVWYPSNATIDPHGINHAATLCRRLVNVLFADPPAPELEPDGTDEIDVEAAEHGERILVSLQSTEVLNTVKGARRAVDRACSYGSGFVRYWVDPRAGGRQAIEVEAGYDPTTGAVAEHIDEAARRPVMQPVPDPFTGAVTMQPATDEMGEPVLEEWPDYRNRYARPDGSLTDERSEAAERWMPGLCTEILTGNHVRLLPHTADDIEEAQGVQVAAFVAWGQLVEMFDEETRKRLRGLDAETRKKLFAFRPEEGAEDLLPPGDRGRLDPNHDNPDETLVFVLTTYYDGRRTAEYPHGAYVVTVADRLALVRERWEAEVDGKPELLPIPIAQYKMPDEGRDEPYGVGAMELLGSANNVRSSMIASMLDHLERFNNRKTFLPIDSTINPKDLQLPTKTVLPVKPGGEPHYEQIPQYPRDAVEVFGITTKEMDAGIGLNETAQGLEDPSVESGRHALAIISQVHAGLSGYKEMVQNGYIRECVVQMALVRAYYDRPRRVRWKGEDGRYRDKLWSGADLLGGTQVRVKPGTLTMLTTGAKAQLRRELFQEGVIPPEMYRDLVSSDIGGLVGLEDDPHRLRIKRQINDWAEGPPEGWQPAPPQTDPMTGQPIPAPDPKLAAIWMPVLADTLPQVAQLRLMELAKLQASTRYLRQPPPWRQGVDLEYQRMLMAVQQAQMAMQPQPPGETDGTGETAAEAGDRNEAARADAAAMRGVA